MNYTYIYTYTRTHMYIYTHLFHTYTLSRNSVSIKFYSYMFTTAPWLRIQYLEFSEGQKAQWIGLGLRMRWEPWEFSWDFMEIDSNGSYKPWINHENMGRNGGYVELIIQTPPNTSRVNIEKASCGKSPLVNRNIKGPFSIANC